MSTRTSETSRTTRSSDQLVWQSVQLAVECLDRMKEVVFELRLGFRLVPHALVRQVDLIGEKTT